MPPVRPILTFSGDTHMFLFKKNMLIKRKIEDYLSMVNETLDKYEEGMRYYLQNHIDDHFHTLVEQTHGCESKADDLRREIESELFEKALLPEIREDIMFLIEHMDKIPNKCEKILRRIYTHNIRLPEELNGKVLELVRLGVETCRCLKGAVLDVLETCEDIKNISRRIDSDESVADKIEQELIYTLFRKDYDPVERLIYRDIILWISGLVDRAERITDQLTIFAIKREV